MYNWGYYRIDKFSAVPQISSEWISIGRYKKLDDAVQIRKAAEMLVDECLEDYKNGIPFPDKLPVEKLYK